MSPYTKYVPISIAFLFLTSNTALSCAFPNDDEGQAIVNNIVAAVSGSIPLDDTVSQGVLHAFHSLYPGKESLKVPTADNIAQPSTVTLAPVSDDAPQPSSASSSPPAVVSSPDLMTLYRQMDRRKGMCEEDLSTENMSSFFVFGKSLLKEILAKLITLNKQVPGSDTKTTFRAALITAALKRNLMPSGPLAEACLPGEFLSGLIPNKHTSARNYATHRKGFALELIRHKNASLGQYGTWTNQLRSLTGLEYKSPERTAFDDLHRYFTRLWDAFFTVERLVRDVGLTLYPDDLFYGLLGDKRLLHWTENCPDFAQKFIQTWDTLFIYYTHHLLANAANPALDKFPDLLRVNNIDLARINAQPYITDKATSLVFVQAPAPQKIEEAIVENSVSIKERESSSGEDSSGEETTSTESDTPAGTANDDDAVLHAPSPRSERTPLYPSVLLPETAPQTLHSEKEPFNAFEIYMGIPYEEPKPHNSIPTSASTSHLPSCWEVLGIDPEWDLSDLCQDDQTGEEGDIPQKDEYNGTND